MALTNINKESKENIAKYMADRVIEQMNFKFFSVDEQLDALTQSGQITDLDKAYIKARVRSLLKEHGIRKVH